MWDYKRERRKGGDSKKKEKKGQKNLRQLTKTLLVNLPRVILNVSEELVLELELFKIVSFSGSFIKKKQ